MGSQTITRFVDLMGEVHFSIIIYLYISGSLNSTETSEITSLRKAHVTASKKKAPPMFNSTRELLTKFYAQYNQKLATLMSDSSFLWDE